MQIRYGYWTALAFFLGIVSATSAQQRPGAELNVSNSGIRYNDTSGHVTMFDFRTVFSLGKRSGSAGASSFTGSFAYKYEGFNNFPASYGSDIQSLSLGLGWKRALGDRHVLGVTGDVGIYSDFSNLTGKAIRESVGISYITKYSDHLALVVGLQYRNQFYGNQLIPVIGLMYTGGEEDRWRLSGVLPFNPKLTYRLNRANGISLELKQSFSSYLLSGATDGGDYVKTEHLTLALNYEYRFSKSWRFNAGFGYAVTQQYELYSDAAPRRWYILSTALGGKVNPITSISHGGPQVMMGLTFQPKF